MPEPILLLIESSAEWCSVAVYNNKKLTQLKSPVKNQHAESLLDLIEQVLFNEKLTLHDLHGLVLSDGPGSYTGLRIGSSTAKGICFSMGIPLVAVSTLESIASSALELHNAEFIWPMIDARRMEVYHCIYNREMQPQFELVNGIVDQIEFKQFIPSASTILCGDGAKKASLELGLECIELIAEAKHLLAIGLKKFKEKAWSDLSTYEPFYLKSANITSPRNI